jgi:hypothetical protein
VFSSEQFTLITIKTVNHQWRFKDNELKILPSAKLPSEQHASPTLLLINRSPFSPQGAKNGRKRPALARTHATAAVQNFFQSFLLLLHSFLSRLNCIFHSAAAAATVTAAAERRLLPLN